MKDNDSSLINWINVLTHPSLVRGTLNITSNQVDFLKCSEDAIKETVQRGEYFQRLLDLFKDNNSGCRICFVTNSDTVFIKGRVRRRWSHGKLTHWGGSGLDVYKLKNNYTLFEHISVYGPVLDGADDFYFSIINRDAENPFYIYLPTYNCIEELYVGVKEGCYLREEWNFESLVPVIFFGNSVTQGASASRSGNAYPNIVQRKLQQNILNLSFSGFCLGQKGFAEEIGKLNCRSIVIDYSRNEADKEIFREKYVRFYSLIRELHPNVRIIFLTSFNFNNMKEFSGFDNIINDVYKKAVEDGENVKLINTMNCFSNMEYDLLATDGCHLNDAGMYIIASEIVKKIVEE